MPVTQEMLNDPEPGQWLHWRGTQNAWGYSPLDQITPANVGQLRLVWAWAMDDTGPQEAAPLIHNGVMYVPNPGNVVQALDAANGDLLWEYRPEPVGDGTGAFGRGVQKNIAIFGDRIFGASSRATIFALDARSGKLIWETQTADTSLGYRYTAGPIVANGKLVTGITGCGRYKDDVCFITGHDPDTGEEIWRTSTIARPGEPGGDTWGDLPLRFRAGSDSLDRRQLRPGAEDRLLGHVPGQALGPLRPRHGRRRAVHELEPGARSRHRRTALVLPVPARRDPRHGRGLRDAPHRRRRPQEALQDGQARHSLAARPGDGRVPGRDRRRLPEPRRRGPRDGRGDLPAGTHPGDRRRDQHVPEYVRLQGLARHVVRPEHRRPLHPDDDELRAGDVRPRRAGARRRWRGSGQADQHAPPLLRRQPRRVAGHRRPGGGHHVAAPDALADQPPPRSPPEAESSSRATTTATSTPTTPAAERSSGRRGCPPRPRASR